ncbi:MAG: phosphatidylglycerophosphatase A [Candidatus Cloacimonadales bacterium]
MSLIKKISSNFNIYFATVLGIGFIPFAPGTLATLFTAVIWYLIPDYIFYNKTEQLIYYNEYLYLLLILIVLYIIGIFSTTKAEKLMREDDPKIVFDELVGYLFAVLFLPKTLMITIYAFILFRAFDIGKPFPINKSQKFKAGLGIMTDDVLAGIFSNALLQLLIIIYPNFFK